MIFIIIIAIWIISAIYSWIDGLYRDKAEANSKLNLLKSQVDELIYIRNGLDQKIQSIKNSQVETEKWAENKKKSIQNMEENLRIKSMKTHKDFEAMERNLQNRTDKINSDLNQLVLQRSKGFPLLGEVYQEYFDVKSKIDELKQRHKKRPAPKAADAIKESNHEKRKLIYELKILEKKIKNYEAIAPYLAEASEEEMPMVDDQWLLEKYKDYSDEEAEDMATRFLTIEEYRSLGTQQKYQLALDRYWSRRKKSSWLIGKIYERYIGFLYEQKGYKVEYQGIRKRYEDEGKDLIAIKGKECLIIQCKHWAKFRTIYENSIFQLFGTTYEYMLKHPEQKVSAVFYTSTDLSPAAREFSKRLEIKVMENTSLNKYPCIKCNISKRSKEKIYHLPFDQQYDNVNIETNAGEFYCETVREAEKKGFRRAFKWHPQA